MPRSRRGHSPNSVPRHFASMPLSNIYVVATRTVRTSAIPDAREPKVPVDREGQDRKAEVGDHGHDAESSEYAGIKEERVRPKTGQVRRHDDDVDGRDEDDREAEPQ